MEQSDLTPREVSAQGQIPTHIPGQGQITGHGQPTPGSMPAHMSMSVPTKRNSPIDPLQVTRSLGYQTFRRETRQPWTKAEDALLKSLVEEHYNPKIDMIKWDVISKRLDSRKPKDCRKRWSNSLDPSLRKGKWTAEEDKALLQAFGKWGTSWQKVSQDIVGRTDDQCAKRYMEVLDPNTKDRLRPWTRDEDLELIKRVKKYGTKWRTISMEMANRPSLTCRNRWRKIVTDVVRGKADQAIVEEVNLINNGIGYVPEPKPSPEVSPNGVSPIGISPGEATPHTPYASSHSTPNAPSPFPYLSPPHMLQPPQTSNLRFLSQSPRPVETRTEWKYSAQTASGEPVPQGFGDIVDQDSAARLIAVAKSHGLSITIHQHIHHHYAPLTNRNLLEPETQLNRYQHFNYLPPLAEVPKLTSLATSPAGSSNEDKGQRSDLMKLLNNDKLQQPRPFHPAALRVSPGPSERPYKRAKAEYERKTPLSQAAYPAKSPQYANAEELDEELDFWETMRSLTKVTQVQTRPQVQAQSQHQSQNPPQLQLRPHPQVQPVHAPAPVSQHHPLHYASNISDFYGSNFMFEEEADVDEDVYGLFYSIEAKKPGEEESRGVLPFNPS
ncbi:hypothetical protein BABINDRAFT_160422 [Babjeviella inositovora NRRL Y-12698]|uniref:Uncharacterized protein n=1 Tax=Babjeviella inositovora NRRL Y-12698 TaxID=984486 RepID=A0A1E3QVB0_9ASCO|nr:uncharacterized protein BABINDRAFT_160422 [Babjeviella inositovora NRRL Y-12698]ODQ81002.1 hypothetical protein BABINDRAFT_160422 [Babjeviella inositovora NRRL Y-12698]